MISRKSPNRFAVIITTVSVGLGSSVAVMSKGLPHLFRFWSSYERNASPLLDHLLISFVC